MKIDPEMVQLASQLVQRQSGTHDAAELEDRYETRLRAMIDANLKGEGLDVSEPEAACAHQRGRSDGCAEEELGSDDRRKETCSSEEKGCCRQGHAYQAAPGCGQAQATLNRLLLPQAFQPIACSDPSDCSLGCTKCFARN
jgi:hypothetical protein